MSNLLKRGSEFLSAQRTASMSEAVVYRRGEAEITPNATLGRTEYEVIGESIGVDIESVDFIIRAEDLDFGSGATEPAEGDEIDWEKDGATYTHIVRRDASGKHWKHADEFKNDLRIHTKLKGKS
jgi:hypothetical protein